MKISGDYIAGVYLWECYDELNPNNRRIKWKRTLKKFIFHLFLWNTKPLVSPHSQAKPMHHSGNHCRTIFKRWRFSSWVSRKNNTV